MVTMKFEGGQEFARALAQLSTAVSRKVQRDALKEAAFPMQKRMEELAKPRGQHFDSPIAIGTPHGLDENEIVVSVGPTKSFFYGFEYGTKFIPARPFARPAFDEVAPESLRILRIMLMGELARQAALARKRQ